MDAQGLYVVFLMSYTIDELIEIVKNSKTYNDVYKATNCLRSRARKREVLNGIENNNIDASHLVTRLPTTRPYKNYSFEEILIKDGPYRGTSADMKRRLFAAGMLKNECYICHITDWLGNPLSLQLDHINGRHTDNRLENLRILCPNCHAQTPTFAGKNSRLGRNPPTNCPKCKGKKHRQSETCLNCSRELNQKIAWPANEELFTLVKELGLCKTASKFNTTAPVLKKRLKVRGFDYLPYKKNKNGK